jgi:hypothetical protein
MDLIAGASPRRLARIAGALYLVNILAGAFSIGVVSSFLVVHDMGTTAHNIQTHELLYRLGLVAHVVVTVTNVPMAVIFYELFKVVNRRIAILDMLLGLVATAIEAASLLYQFTPVVLLGSGRYTSALPPAQLHALAYLPTDLATTDYAIYTVFYGLGFITSGYLVLRSTFLPKTIGVLLGIDALTYLFNGFATMLAPGFAAHLMPWIGLPTIVAEGTWCLWLLIAGVNLERWNEQASAAIRMRAAQVAELA